MQINDVYQYNIEVAAKEIVRYRDSLIEDAIKYAIGDDYTHLETIERCRLENVGDVMTLLIDDVPMITFYPVTPHVDEGSLSYEMNYQLHYKNENYKNEKSNVAEGKEYYVMIKKGSTIMHDHRFGEWPFCCPPRSEYEGKEYQHEASDPDMRFVATFNRSGWRCRADGYGNLKSKGEDGEYGNGCVFVGGLESVEVLGEV